MTLFSTSSGIGSDGGLSAVSAAQLAISSFACAAVIGTVCSVLRPAVTIATTRPASATPSRTSSRRAPGAGSDPVSRTDAASWGEDRGPGVLVGSVEAEEDRLVRERLGRGRALDEAYGEPILLPVVGDGGGGTGAPGVPGQHVQNLPEGMS